MYIYLLVIPEAPEVKYRENGSIESVKTAMNYLGQNVEKVWTIRDETGTDGPVEGAEWEPVDVEVKNGRGAD